MTVGIYKLNFKNTDKVYIGQSLKIENRVTRHLNSFKINTNSHKLMSAYNTYGYCSYDIVCECLPEELDSAENEAIEIWNSVDEGFNTRYNAIGKTSLVGDKAPGSIYSNKQILKVFFSLLDSDELYRHIAEQVGVSRECVKGIAAGTRHTWLAKDYPKEHLLLMNKKNLRSGSILERYGNTIALKHDNGTVEEVSNIRQFCLKHSLDDGHLGKVINKKQISHKGWRLVS
jgi:hypothetical protein